MGGLLALTHYASAKTYFTGYDGNGNVTVLIDGVSGLTEGNFEYGPFGELIRASGTAAAVCPWRFSTKYEDSETGQLYYGYRFYSPSTGRWLSRDPVGEMGGINVYGFVDNGPLRAVDVLGAWKWYNPYTWIYDPEDHVYHPPKPLPPPPPPPTVGNQFENLFGEVGDEGFHSFCYQLTDTAYSVMEATGADDLSQAATGTTLRGKDGSHLGGAVGVGGGTVVVLGKKIWRCCKFVYVCVKAKVVRKAPPAAHIALGYGWVPGFRNFANDKGAQHLLDDDNWKDTVASQVKNANCKFSVRLDGFTGDSVEEMIQNELQNGSHTGWELQQLLEAGRLGEAELFLGGQGVPNPF